jgi:hypothetical protein
VIYALWCFDYGKIVAFGTPMEDLALWPHGGIGPRCQTRHCGAGGAVIRHVGATGRASGAMNIFEVPGGAPGLHPARAPIASRLVRSTPANSIVNGHAKVLAERGERSLRNEMRKGLTRCLPEEGK